MRRLLEKSQCLLYAALLVASACSSFAADELPWEVAIRQLVSKNSPPEIDNDSGDDPTFPKSFSEEENERVANLAWKIQGNAAEALPLLIAHRNDGEYAFTQESGEGYWSNWTVGKICETILRVNIEVRRDLVSEDNRLESRNLIGRSDEARDAYWLVRRDKSLPALQLEWFEHVQRLESSLEQPNEKSLKILRATIAEIRATGKPEPGGIEWRTRPK